MNKNHLVSMFISPTHPNDNCLTQYVRKLAKSGLYYQIPSFHNKINTKKLSILNFWEEKVIFFGPKSNNKELAS